METERRAQYSAEREVSVRQGMRLEHESEYIKYIKYIKYIEYIKYTIMLLWPVSIYIFHFKSSRQVLSDNFQTKFLCLDDRRARITVHVLEAASDSITCRYTAVLWETVVTVDPPRGSGEIKASIWCTLRAEWRG